MVDSLKRKTIAGVFWSAIERFSLQGVQFAINIVMARLLLPSDYGMIGMLAVFLQISQTFIDSGFASALIQRQDRSEVDFSTVFYFNTVIAFLIYFLIFICAPQIANFYHMPDLVLVTRVIAVTLILNSLSAIHKIKLTIKIDFKTQSKASLIAAVVSGIIGIWMAYSGFGVWSLVCQTLLNSLLLTSLFYFFFHWKPQLVFSTKSFKELFHFGSKLLLSSMLHTVYRNLYTIVIGRRFSATELGYYSRAEQFAVFPSSNINAIISRVTYPILSMLQDDNVRLALAYRKYIRLSSFFIFPLMIGLAVLAKPVILLLLTDKWSGIIILLQILCIDWMLDHLSSINLNLLYVKGRSDLALRLEIVKKTLATIILFTSIPFGIVGMCWGRVLYSFIATYLNTYYTKSLIGLNFWTQMKYIFPYLLISLSMGVCVYWISNLFTVGIMQLVVSVLAGILIYLFLSYFLCRNIIVELISLKK